MKKFITVIPLQVRGQLRQYHYRAVGNERLELGSATSFPILAAVNGYVEPGEAFRVIAVSAGTDDARRNQEALRAELEALCRKRGFVCPAQLDIVMAPADERVSSHISVFQDLIDLVEDDDELFACITYGTKPLSQAVLLAVQYAYRVKRNASISCIVYGQIDRSQSAESTAWTAKIYDETALIQLGEIVRVLADQNVTDPKRVIQSILSL